MCRISDRIIHSRCNQHTSCSVVSVRFLVFPMCYRAGSVHGRFWIMRFLVIFGSVRLLESNALVFAFLDRRESTLQINAVYSCLALKLCSSGLWLWFRRLCTSVLGHAKVAAISDSQMVLQFYLVRPGSSWFYIGECIMSFRLLQDTSTIACSACEVGLHARDRGWGVDVHVRCLRHPRTYAMLVEVRIISW